MKDVKIQQLCKVQGITFWLIDTNRLRQIDKKWGSYLGSHHWGKGAPVIITGKRYDGTAYIPADEIWIADHVTDPQELCEVMKHEYIERPLMRTLEEQGLSREQAWNLAHPRASRAQSCTTQDRVAFCQSSHRFG